MSAPKKEPSLRVILEQFLATELARQTAENLKSGAIFHLHIDDSHFTYRRAEGENLLEDGSVGAPDGEAWMSINTLHHILAKSYLPGAGVGSMGVAIFERALHSDESNQLKLKLRTNLFTLWRKGYFSVLKAGGPEVASYLGRLGKGGLSWLKDLLHKF